MTIAPRNTIIVPLQVTHTREHDRRSETLRFSETYATVKRSGAYTNQRLGADSVTRGSTPDSPTGVFLPKGASA